MLAIHRIQGSLFGAAIGDTLGMPLEMLSHQNVRTYYRGLREPVGDEKRGDLEKGQVTSRSQFMMLLGRSLISGVPIVELPELRRVGPFAGLPHGTAIAASTMIGVMAGIRGTSDESLAENVAFHLAQWIEKPETLVAGYGQARFIRDIIQGTMRMESGEHILSDLTPALFQAESMFDADNSVSARINNLQQHLNAFPLDLQDYCGGTGSAPDQAWPFAVAMFARDPFLVDAGMLSAVNVGGDAPTVGPCLGALFGALHGLGPFPKSWVVSLEIKSHIIDLTMRMG